MSVCNRKARISKPKFPVRCKTWDEVKRIQEKYCKVVGHDPKGGPCYDFEEVCKHIIFPKD
jgi:hypothetical protein